MTPELRWERTHTLLHVTDIIMNEHLQPLAELLRRRLAVIGDATFRDGNPQGHLASLREVSEAINAEHVRLKPHLPPRLRHFLEQASYQKALAYLDGQDE